MKWKDLDTAELWPGIPRIIREFEPVRPLESQLILSKAEVQTLKKAHLLLEEIREQMDGAFGEDSAIYLAEGQAWVFAEAHLGSALHELSETAIRLPPRGKDEDIKP